MTAQFKVKHGGAVVTPGVLEEVQANIKAFCVTIKPGLRIDWPYRLLVRALASDAVIVTAAHRIRT